ncbi:unnamed protein product [Caenorhabditis angaria]|uniref:G-protein coupled receptors family 1 profile domain-containing protein n=1 Tax=Caenorhabditis angaria TaxID=860376 RepID=A0A9P1IV02_9PELO|nr:unnamed protein product [Caenorhabditis angaria]
MLLYSIFTILVSCVQFLLVFLIFKNRSVLMTNMRIYLLNISVAQMITALAGFLTQCRMIPNQNTVGFICSGVCTHFDTSSICFGLHLLKDASSTSTLFAITHVFYFRYKVLSHQKITKFQQIRNFILVHSPAIFCAICQFTNPSDRSMILKETLKNHQKRSIEQSAIFGFSSLHSPFVRFSTFLFTFMLILNPIIAFIYRRKIRVLLNDYGEYNIARIRNAKSLISGLTWQTITPCICFIPLLSQFFLAQYFGVRNLALEHLSTFFVIVPTLIDPILSFYFIIPFRRAIKDVFKEKEMIRQDGTTNSL